MTFGIFHTIVTEIITQKGVKIICENNNFILEVKQMSKNNKHKKQNEPNEVFMQITNPDNNEKCMLKIPTHFKNVLDSLMSDAERKDYRNSHEILQFFCEIYTAFDKKRERTMKYYSTQKWQRLNILQIL